MKNVIFNLFMILPILLFDQKTNDKMLSFYYKNEINQLDSIYIYYKLNHDNIYFIKQEGSKLLPDDFYKELFKEISVDMKNCKYSNLLDMVELKTYYYIHKKIRDIEYNKKKIKKV